MYKDSIYYYEKFLHLISVTQPKKKITKNLNQSAYQPLSGMARSIWILFIQTVE